jgi:hypothetical protein
VVRTADGGEAFADLPGVLDPLFVVVVGLLEQSRVDFRQRVAGNDAADDDDRDKFVRRALAVDGYTEDRWRVGCRVCRMRRPFRGERRADEGVVFAPALREDGAT